MVMDDVFAVIAEGTRREILLSLRRGDKAVGELVEELAVSQPTVSKHLKVLREAGLVTMRAVGQRRFYALETAPLAEVALWLRAFDSPRAAPAVTVPPTAADEIAASGLLDEGVQQLSRTVGRAAERAADIIAHLPKLRRRKD